MMTLLRTAWAKIRVWWRAVRFAWLYGDERQQHQLDHWFKTGRTLPPVKPSTPYREAAPAVKDFEHLCEQCGKMLGFDRCLLCGLAAVDQRVSRRLEMPTSSGPALKMVEKHLAEMGPEEARRRYPSLLKVLDLVEREACRARTRLDGQPCAGRCENEVCPPMAHRRHDR